MSLKNVTRIGFAFGVCLLGVPAAFAQSLDSQGRVSKPLDNRITTQQGTVYGREKAQREADRQADFHSRYQPKRSEAWAPRRYTSSSYKPTTYGSKAGDAASSSSPATTTDPLSDLKKRSSENAQDFARTKAMMRSFDKPGSDTTSVIGKQAPFSATTTPGYIGTIPSRVTPDASRAAGAGKKEGDIPSLYGGEQDAADTPEVPDLLKHVKSKKSSDAAPKEDADAQK